MNTEELKNLTQLYFDGGLERSKEPFLFTSLSRDEDARDYFKSMNLLKNAVEETEEEFPQELEERIFYSLKKKEIKSISNFFNLPVTRIISYSIAIILIIINIYLLGRINSYNDKMNSVQTVVQNQNHMIELLFNSLPATEVKAIKTNNHILN
jgi:hypothetical protein